MADINAHYSTGGKVLPAIEEGVGKLGKTTSTVNIEDLAPADEFHTGGATTAAQLFETLGLASDELVLDIGAGLGGPARRAAATRGVSVTGCDLTADFVEAGNIITSWPGIGLQDKVTLLVGNALDMAFASAASFDAAYMIHVGMNIDDKKGLATEISRVLKPGGRFGVFDPMLSGAVPCSELQFPMPFASAASECALTTADEYKAAFEAAGLTLTSQIDRTGDTMEMMKSSMGKGPSVLSLKVVMGDSLPMKGGNLMKNLGSGGLCLQEIVWTKK